MRYVRFTITSNQGHAEFMDLAELTVYGVPRPTCLGLPAHGTAPTPRTSSNGGSGADVIVGLGGNDNIDGKGGKDDDLRRRTGTTRSPAARRSTSSPAARATTSSRPRLRRELALYGGPGRPRSQGRVRQDQRRRAPVLSAR